MKEHLKDSNLTDGNDQDKPQSCLHKVISTSETAVTGLHKTLVSTWSVPKSLATLSSLMSPTRAAATAWVCVCLWLYVCLCDPGLCVDRQLKESFAGVWMKMDGVSKVNGGRGQSLSLSYTVSSCTRSLTFPLCLFSVTHTHVRMISAMLMLLKTLFIRLFMTPEPIISENSEQQPRQLEEYKWVYKTGWTHTQTHTHSHTQTGIQTSTHLTDCVVTSWLHCITLHWLIHSSQR